MVVTYVPIDSASPGSPDPHMGASSENLAIPTARLLLVEDDASVARLMSRALQEAGYTVVSVASAHEAREALADGAERPHAVLLDLQLPDDSGLSLLEEFRASCPETPVIIVTGQRGDADIVRGLDAGADDYLVKPFALSVLVARVRAVLRRGAAVAAETVRVGDLQFDRLNRTISAATGALTFTPKEYALLEYFLLRPETIVSRTELLEKVWGHQFDPGSNLVDVHIARLRRKLQDNVSAPVLRTVRGRGFQLTAHAVVEDGLTA